MINLLPSQLLIAVIAAGLMLPGPRPAGASSPRSLEEGEAALSLAVRDNHALIADATIELRQPAALFMEYGNERIGWLRTTTSDVRSRHRVPLIRLRAQMDYQVRALALNQTGCAVEVATGTFQSGPLPEELASLEVESVGQPSFALALMDWRSLSDPGETFRIRSAMALDHENQVVWYVPTDRRLDAKQPALVLTKLQTGNWLFLLTGSGIREYTPDARLVRNFRLARGTGALPHHDLVQMPDGRVLFLGWEDHPVAGSEQPLRGDVLIMLDLATGRVDKVWSSFDSLDPAERPSAWETRPSPRMDDWTHGNSVAIGPRGNVVVSMRHLNQAISIKPDLSGLEWKLGGPGSSFAFPQPSDRFYHQHSVTELPGNRILLLDNGNFRPEGEYSRALELELDYQTMTARRVWESDTSPISTQTRSATPFDSRAEARS